MLGSCLCGEIKYEVTQLDTPIEHCSCYTCRKAHSAAFNTAAGVNRENFKWLKGKSILSSYESSPGKSRYFCSSCGSHLIADIKGKPYIMLRVATLDENPGQKPELQIWRSHEVPWLSYGPHIPAYKEWEA